MQVSRSKRFYISSKRKSRFLQICLAAIIAKLEDGAFMREPEFAATRRVASK
jgi:hypothetical protein